MERMTAHMVLTNHQKWRRGCDETPPTEPKRLGAAIDVALEALLIAAKLMQEPSEGMVEGALQRDKFGNMYVDIFTAMRDQLIKEVMGEQPHDQ